ncbi:carbohydrate sulfotransferase 15-like [Mercenaria mercenaria]|uniref:carbohydrate sulfotransferase 15-like n=1 Tax=Mercenaria mercenaria TaxID=6596 RepID=UPI00234FB594|nr:carbohydrate sulfotransferase 15-like [Mercenaria mercenaria]
MIPCVCKFMRRLMQASSIKQALKCCGWIFLFSYTLWIYITLDAKEQHTAHKRHIADNYYLNYLNESSFARVNQARIHRSRNYAMKAGRSRRSQGFKEPKEGRIEAIDFHLQHGHRVPLLQKMLQSYGQEFGRHVNDPNFKEKHDFRDYQTPIYLKNFKNPCLFKNASVGRYTRSRGIVQLRCVPYFMIAGFPKCGKTDLWSKLIQHPEVAWLHMKEINFFNKKQYDFVSIEKAVNFYQDSLRASTEKITRCVSEKKADFHQCITGSILFKWSVATSENAEMTYEEFGILRRSYFHPYVIQNCLDFVYLGDGSFDTIFDNKFWRLLPGNERQTEPALTNANYVHRINPNMKIIVLLREPVERLYSDYLYMSSSVGYVCSPEDFHSTVVDRIGNFTSCRRHRTLRACVYDMYDDWNIQTYKVRLNVGMYHIFLSDWLKVFPQNNVLVVKSEDTRGPNKMQILMKIFKFLGLTVPSTKQLQDTYSSRYYTNERNRNSKRMLSKTRKLLQEFYQTFNQQLETMLPHIHY